MRSTLLFSTAVLIASLSSISPPAGAGGLGLGDRLQMPAPAFAPPVKPDRQLSPNDAARIAQQQNGGGKVLSVERADRGYRVKLLKNGDVRIVYVPGN